MTKILRAGRGNLGGIAVGGGAVNKLPRLAATTPASIAYNGTQIVITPPIFPGGVGSSLNVSYEAFRAGASIGPVSTTFTPPGLPATFYVRVRATATGYRPYSGVSNNLNVLANVGYPYLSSAQWEAGEEPADSLTRRVYARTTFPPPVSGKVWAVARGSNNASALDYVGKNIGDWNFTFVPMTYDSGLEAYDWHSAGTFAKGQTDAAMRLALVNPAAPNDSSKEWATDIRVLPTISGDPVAPGAGDWSVTQVAGGYTINLINLVNFNGRAGIITVETTDTVTTAVTSAALPNGNTTGNRFVANTSANLQSLRLIVSNANGSAASTAKTVTPGAAAPTETVITVGEEQFTLAGAVSYRVHPGDVIELLDAGSGVQFTARKFAPTGSGTTLRNGQRKNPAYGSQAFDGRGGNRDATAPDAFPLTLVAGDTFVAAVSTPNTMTSPRSGPVKAYYPFFVTSALQDAAAQAPAIFKWPGRTGALTTLPVVDYLALAATLPTTFGVGSFAYEPLETVRYNLRFNPGRAISNSNSASGGYEHHFPNGWAGSTSSGDANYGRWQGGRLGDYFMYLAAPLDQVSLATKAVILEAMDRYRIQSKTVMDAVGQTLQGDGAHGQFDCGIWLLSYWMRGETSLLNSGLAGNWREQYFKLDAGKVSTWYTPWGNENDPSAIRTTTVPATDGPPNTSYRRKIFAVDTVNNTITIPVWKGGTSSSQGDGGKSRYDGMYLRRISDNFQTWITSDQTGDITTNNAVSYKVLKVRNATGFAVNDVVFMYPGFTPAVDLPVWRLNSDATSNLHIPSAGAEYQQLQRDWGMKMLLRILGLYRDSWQDMWDYGVYANKTGLPASTPEVVDYPKLYETGSLSEAAWTQYESTIQAIPQPSQTPPATVIYPNVAAVDVLAAGGSTQFQQGDTDTQLLQPRTNLTVPASTSAWSWAFIYRKPRDKRVVATVEQLFRGGDTGVATSAFFIDHRQRLASGNSDKMEYRHRGPSNSVVSGIYSATWTEDAGLFVLNCDGAGNFQFDWYSLTDGVGTRYPGTPVNSSQNAITTINQANLHMRFGGEMEMICQVRGAVSPATWQSIAQGADLGSTIGASNFHWVREFNGTTASLTKPAWVGSNDQTSPMTLGSISGTGTPAQYPGSHIVRPAGAGLTFDLYSGGWVHGLIKGQTTKFITMSGKAWGGASGVVQMKVWQAENGRVVRDWVTIATISGGTWSGTIELPKGEDMFHRAVRLGSNPSVEYHDRNSFGVGWRIMVMGQSELNELFGSADPSTLSRPNRTSYLTNQESSNNLDMRRLGGERSGQDAYGAIAMANQIRQFDPEVPVQIVREVIVGTGMDQLIANSSARPWDLAGDTSNNGSLGDKLTKYGNDISAVVHMWASNERNIGFQPFKDRLSALVFGTGPDATGRFLNNVLQTGYRFVLVPHTRTAGGHNVVRRASIEWAYDNAASNVDIGVLPNDTSNSNTVNSHQDAEGGKMLARQLAISAGKALGLTNWTQPYFTGSTMNAARNQITITVARPNGGNLFSPAIALGIDLSGFYVSDGGTSTYRYQNGLYVNTGGSNGKTVRTGADTFKLPAVGGFTARIVDNDVVLAKTSGSWSAGTKWYHEAQGQYGRSWDNSLPGTGDDIDTVGNREVVDGALYESWAPDILNRGLTVGGRIISSRWNIENVENIDGQIFDTWTPTDTAPPLTATAVPTQSRSGNTITVTAPTWNVTPDTVTAIKNIDGAETSFGGGTYTLAPGSTGYVRYTAVKAGYSNGQTTSTTITNPAAAAPTIRSEAGSVASSDVTTWTATLPSGIVTGDTLYAWVTVDGNNTAVTQTATQPWTVLQDTAVGSSFKFLHLKKVATGTDTLSFSVATGERFAAKIICINGAVATEAIGALTSGRDATGIDMITSNDTLVISAVIADGPSTNFADTNQPAGYTFLGTAARSQAATTGTVVALATLTAVQQTFDPGAWSGPNPTNSRSIVMGLR